MKPNTWPRANGHRFGVLSTALIAALCCQKGRDAPSSKDETPQVATYETLLKRKPEIAFALGAITKSMNTQDLIRTLPCCDIFRRKKQGTRQMRGALALRIEGDGSGFGVTDVRAHSGDIDDEIASCLHQSFIWTRRWYGRRSQSSVPVTWVQWDVVLAVPPREVPSLSGPWRLPDAWQTVYENVKEPPAGWAAYVSETRRAGELAELKASPVPQSQVMTPFLAFSEFLRVAPVLGNALYSRVATRESYEGISTSECVRAMAAKLPPSTPSIEGSFGVTLGVMQGMARIEQFRFADGIGSKAFAECVRKVGNWPDSPFSVVGERDGVYRLRWVYRYPLAHRNAVPK